MPDESPRFDPVTPLHKAVRHLMFQVLSRVGALDTTDIFEVDGCTGQALQLVRLLPAHSADDLLPLLDGLRRQPDAGEQAVAAAALYRALARVVAEQLQAQLQTEVTHLPLLQAQHTDLELRLLRRQQLAAMAEPELAAALQPMAEALTPQELAAFVDDLQMSVDAQTFGCLLDNLRRRTAAGRWQRLARELGLPETGTPPPARAAGHELPGESAGRGGEPGPPRRPGRGDRQRMRTQ